MRIQDLLRTAYDEFHERRFADPDTATAYRETVEAARLAAEVRRKKREEEMEKYRESITAANSGILPPEDTETNPEAE